jgi:hypothetical protein
MPISMLHINHSRVKELSRNCMSDIEKISSRFEYAVVKIKNGELDSVKFLSFPEIQSKLVYENKSMEEFIDSSILAFENQGLKTFVFG